MAFKAMYGNLPETDVKADYREAVKFGTFRIGREALIFRPFPQARNISRWRLWTAPGSRKAPYHPRGAAAASSRCLYCVCGTEMSSIRI